MRNNELGWKIAFWALGALEALAVAVLLDLRTEVKEQGKHIANIEGRMGFGSNVKSETNYVWVVDKR